VDPRGALELAAALEQLGGGALVAQREKRLAGFGERAGGLEVVRGLRMATHLCVYLRGARGLLRLEQRARELRLGAGALVQRHGARELLALHQEISRALDLAASHELLHVAFAARRRGLAPVSAQDQRCEQEGSARAHERAGRERVLARQTRRERSEPGRETSDALQVAPLPAQLDPHTRPRVAAPSAFSAGGNTVLRPARASAEAYLGAVEPRLDPVHRELARFLRASGVTRATRLLAAVSGGSDSVALLHALLAIGQRVGVAHVHHGLRGAEADRELAFVASLCGQLGVALHVEHVDAARRDGRSPEARARALRYAALERIRVSGGYASVLTAHQLDDQAETVLLRALRGTSPAGLAAIRPSLDGGRILRPLLGLRRAELSDYLARRGLAFATDSSNSQLSIPRNRLRAEVVPVLEAIAPAAVANLARLAELAREAEEGARAQLEPVLDGALEAGEGGWWIEAAGLTALDPGLRRRALARLAVRAGLGEHVSRAELSRMDAFVQGARAGQRLSLAGLHSLYRDRGRVWLGPGAGPTFPAPVTRSLAAGESLEFPERRLRLSWHDTPSQLPAPDPLRLPVRPVDRFTVRSVRDADRVHAGGRARRLKDVLAGARWSKLEQARALVVEREGEIIWVPGLVPAADWRATEPPRCEIRAERLSSSR